VATGEVRGSPVITVFGWSPALQSYTLTSSSSLPNTVNETSGGAARSPSAGAMQETVWGRGQLFLFARVGEAWAGGASNSGAQTPGEECLATGFTPVFFAFLALFGKDLYIQILFETICIFELWGRRHRSWCRGYTFRRHESSRRDFYPNLNVAQMWQKLSAMSYGAELPAPTQPVYLRSACCYA